MNLVVTIRMLPSILDAGRDGVEVPHCTSVPEETLSGPPPASRLPNPGDRNLSRLGRVAVKELNISYHAMDI